METRGRRRKEDRGSSQEAEASAEIAITTVIGTEMAAAAILQLPGMVSDLIMKSVRLNL